MSRQRIGVRGHAAVAAAGILAATGSAGAETVIDLGQVGIGQPGFRIEGSAATANLLGYSVAGVGDVNGDGLPDSILGMYRADLKAGQTFVVFGKVDGTRVNVGSLGSLGFRIDGIDPDDWSGGSVSGVGDMNGDGLDDVVVGEYMASPSGILIAGECYVVFGKSDTATIDLGNLGNGGFLIEGADTIDWTGRSVSGAGDVNGDGVPDVVIGAPGAGTAGRAYVVFGKSDSATVDLSDASSAGFQIEGIDPGNSNGIGRAVAGAGDVNGDGLADLIVSDPFADRTGASNVGKTYVVFGKADGAAISVGNLASGGFRIDGISTGHESGWTVSGVGDMNGDGLADVALGASRVPIGSSLNVGHCYVVFGKTDAGSVALASLGGSWLLIPGVDPSGALGSGLSGAGDLNGDGLADMIAGAPSADVGSKDGAGRTFAIFGRAEGGTVNLAALGDGGIRLDGGDQYDSSGSSASGGGDVNGDGLADVVVGAPSAGIRGEAYIVFSPAMPPSVPPATVATSTYKATARTGNARPVAVGICGDGSDDDSPSSRCWIDFDGGQGPGNKNSSMQTVTLTRNDAGIRVLRPERLANVQWRVESNRTGWRKTRVTLKYTDAEIAGLREETLRVWRASSPRGPWALYSSGMVREPQRNRISVNVPALGYFAIEGEPAP